MNGIVTVGQRLSYGLVILGLCVLCGCGSGSGGGSGGNTSTGAGGSQTLPNNFAETNPAVIESGDFRSVQLGSQQRPFRRAESFGCQLDFAIKGTDCTLNMLEAQPGSLEVSVDGAAYKTMDPPAINQFTTLTLFSGLADTPHTVSLKATNTVDVAQFVVDSVNMVAVKGSAPAILSMADVDGQDWGRQQYPLGSANVTPYIVPEAGTFVHQNNDDGTPTNGLFATTYADGSFILKAKCRSVRAFIYETGGKWQATVDGVNQPVVTLANTGTYNWETLASGLDPNQEHLIVLTNVGLGTTASHIYALMFPGGALSTSSPPPTRKVLAVTGHSIVAGAFLPDLSFAYYQGIAQAHNYAIASRGIGGSTFKQFPTGAAQFTVHSGQARIGEITSIQPDICIIDHFINDMNNAAGADPPETPADLQAALTDYLHKVLSQCPNTKFYLLGILDTLSQPAKTAAWNAAIQATVTALNSPRCQFIDPHGWIDPRADTFDGLHPNPQGSQKIASHLGPILFP
jgi:lysophospholipase L1-like esterase